MLSNDEKFPDPLYKCFMGQNRELPILTRDTTCQVSVDSDKWNSLTSHELVNHSPVLELRIRLNCKLLRLYIGYQVRHDSTLLIDSIMQAFDIS